MTPDELAGIAEVAIMLDVTKQTAVKYAARADFPAPLDRLAAGPVWKKADIERWGRQHLPLPTGRPRKPET